jgi:hypothetical protein
MDSLWVSPPENSPSRDLEKELFRASATLTWMIQRSIVTDCIALNSKITKVLLTLNNFVRHVREARSDADGVSRELHSLQTVLDILKEDAASFPAELAEHTPSVIEHCSYIVDKLNESLLILNSPELSKKERRAQWLEVGMTEASTFRTTLEAHKAVIGLAIDLVGAYVL